jgi:hypothetical protein
VLAIVCEYQTKEEMIMVSQICAICDEKESTRQTAVYLGSGVTRFYVVAAEIETRYLMIPTCQQCRGQLIRAQLLNRFGFVVSGFLAVFAVLGIVMVASTAGEGRGIDVGPAVVVALLGLGAVGSFVLYRRGARRLKEYLEKVRWSARDQERV